MGSSGIKAEEDEEDEDKRCSCLWLSQVSSLFIIIITWQIFKQRHIYSSHFLSFSLSFCLFTGGSFMCHHKTSNSIQWSSSSAASQRNLRILNCWPCHLMSGSADKLESTLIDLESHSTDLWLFKLRGSFLILKSCSIQIGQNFNLYRVL